MEESGIDARLCVARKGRGAGGAATVSQSWSLETSKEGETSQSIRARLAWEWALLQRAEPTPTRHFMGAEDHEVELLYVMGFFLWLSAIATVATWMLGAEEFGEAPAATTSSLRRQAWHVCDSLRWVTLWFSVAITLTLWNRWLLSSLDHGQFHFPVTVSSFHFMIQAVLANVVCGMTIGWMAVPEWFGLAACWDRLRGCIRLRSGWQRVPVQQAGESPSGGAIATPEHHPSGADIVPHESGRWSVRSVEEVLSTLLRSSAGFWSHIGPIALATAADVAFSNMAVTVAPVWLYTVGKSTSLCFTYASAVWLKLRPFRWSAVALVSLVLFGVLLAAIGKDTKQSAHSLRALLDSPNEDGHHLLLLGAGAAILAAASNAARWVATERFLKTVSSESHRLVDEEAADAASGESSPSASLAVAASGSPPPRVKVNPLVVMAWAAPVSALATFALALPLEGVAFVESDIWRSSSLGLTAASSVAFGALLAFVMIAAELHVIARVSSVEMTVIGHSKEAIVILLSALLFGEAMQPINAVGVGIVVLGTLLFGVLERPSH
jgi:drug/metabolite transporter (DMT)-like permease